MFKLLSSCCNNINIYRHIIDGNISKVKRYFESNPNKINDQNDLGETPLFTSIKYNQNEIAKYLLFCKKADIEIKNILNESPFWIAACNGNTIMVKLLLAVGASVNDQNDLNTTSLHVAVENGHINTVRVLLKEEEATILNDNYDKPFHIVATTNYIELVDVLLNYRHDINGKNNIGDTALHIATRKKNFKMVSKLIECNASIKIKNLSLKTPLNIARESNCRNIIDFLEGVARRYDATTINKKRKQMIKIIFKGSDELVPCNFCCPISLELFVEPVIASDGHTYERSSIEKWLNNMNSVIKKSPVTNERIQNKNLIPNYNMQSQIKNYIIKK